MNPTITTIDGTNNGFDDRRALLLLLLPEGAELVGVEVESVLFDAVILTVRTATSPSIPPAVRL